MDRREPHGLLLDGFEGLATGTILPSERLVRYAIVLLSTPSRRRRTSSADRRGVRVRAYVQVAQHGDGWFPLTGGPADIARGVQQLRDAYGPEVRSVRGKLELEATIEAAQPWLEAGANILWYVTFPKPSQRSSDDVKRWLDDIGYLREAILAGSGHCLMQ
jgi:hypothetical protein